MGTELLTIGTELLLGQITDTNSSYIASHLPSLGIDLFWISMVGDNPSRLVEVLRRAAHEAGGHQAVLAAHGRVLHDAVRADDAAWPDDGVRAYDGVGADLGRGVDPG